MSPPRADRLRGGPAPAKAAGWAALLVSLGALALATCGRGPQLAGPLRFAPPRRAPAVWALGDEERIESALGKTPLMQENAAWSPEQGLELFALPGETIAFQIVVTAGEEGLSGVTASLPQLAGPRLLEPSARGRPIEQFVVYELPMPRRSGGKDPRESLGWAPAARPPGPVSPWLPDPLVPVDLAAHPEAAKGERPWDYPMTVPARHHRVVWFDVTFADDTPAGSYRGEVSVEAPDGELGRVPLTVEVGATALPYRALRTMLYFEPEAIARRAGSEAVKDYLQLIHRHHLSSILELDSAEDLERFEDMLDGDLFTPEQGYHGPGEGAATDIVVLGCYGGFDMPSPGKLAEVERMVDKLAEWGLGDEPGVRDVFLYAVDEQCDSPRSPAWRRALDEASSAQLRSLRVGHTCSRPPEQQPVDLVMMFAPLFRPAHLQAGDSADKEVWIYNGSLPRTGTFLSDAFPISLRANGWIQAHHGIGRWFYWESTFWDDDNRGGEGPYDPWRTSETFHNQHGDHCNGDGVLVYPGSQAKEGRLDLGYGGVLPSIRLKQWRRGVQDAGYLALARRRDPAASRQISAKLVGQAFDADQSPGFPTEGAPWHQARRQLFEIIGR